jgi:TrwC relaxase
MPIVHVSPLGSSASDVGAAINQIIDYLQRGTKLAQPNTSPTVSYYADSAEGPGVWRGRGVGGHQLSGTVDPDVLREVLSGRHPATGQQLVMATGSAGRAQRERPNVDVATNGPPDELLSTEQVAALLGTSEQYVRKLAFDTRAATNPQTPEEAATYRRARLQGIQLDNGAWAFRREDVERLLPTTSPSRLRNPSPSPGSTPTPNNATPSSKQSTTASTPPCRISRNTR